MCNSLPVDDDDDALPASAASQNSAHGFEPLPARGRPVTNTLIDVLREEEPE